MRQLSKELLSEICSPSLAFSFYQSSKALRQTPSSKSVGLQSSTRKWGGRCKKDFESSCQFSPLHPNLTLDIFMKLQLVYGNHAPFLSLFQYLNHSKFPTASRNPSAITERFLAFEISAKDSLGSNTGST